MFEDLLRRSDELRQRLDAVTVQADIATPRWTESSVVSKPTSGGLKFSTPIDVLVSPTEVNLRHGTGVLIKRIFGQGAGFVSIRTTNHYSEEHDFGEAAFCLPFTGMRRENIFSQAHQWLVGVDVRRVLCIPYFADDLVVAIAVAELFHAPLCVYVMDDHNLFG